VKFIRYTDGYKFQLEEDYEHQTGITPAAPGGNRFVHITLDGLLIIRSGYAWDGASGPAIDTPTFIRGSLVHDALYQLMRLGVVQKAGGRLQADKLLREIVLEDGMWSVRAWWVYHAVRVFGGQYMRGPGNGNTVLTAPRQTDAEAAP
jgi:hypothetical protein